MPSIELLQANQLLATVQSVGNTDLPAAQVADPPAQVEDPPAEVAEAQVADPPAEAEAEADPAAELADDDDKPCGWLQNGLTLGAGVFTLAGGALLTGLGTFVNSAGDPTSVVNVASEWKDIATSNLQQQYDADFAAWNASGCASGAPQPRLEDYNITEQGDKVPDETIVGNPVLTGLGVAFISLAIILIFCWILSKSGLSWQSTALVAVLLTGAGGLGTAGVVMGMQSTMDHVPFTICAFAIVGALLVFVVWYAWGRFKCSREI